MNIKEARRIWGSDVPQEVIDEWIEVFNKRQEAFGKDDPKIPKGATVELDPNEFHSVTTYDGNDVCHNRI
jgi:hypothetical protein